MSNIYTILSLHVYLDYFNQRLHLMKYDLYLHCRSELIFTEAKNEIQCENHHLLL